MSMGQQLKHELSSRDVHQKSFVTNIMSYMQLCINGSTSISTFSTGQQLHFKRKSLKTYFSNCKVAAFYKNKVQRNFIVKSMVHFSQIVSWKGSVHIVVTWMLVVTNATSVDNFSIQRISKILDARSTVQLQLPETRNTFYSNQINYNLRSKASSMNPQRRVPGRITAKRSLQHGCKKGYSHVV